jgi:hypothetical protein
MIQPTSQLRATAHSGARSVAFDQSIMKNFPTWFFHAPATLGSPLAIIKWWEVRRIPYNILIGVYGIISLMLFYFFIRSSGKLEPGEDAVEPTAFIAAAIAVNLVYTAGWLVELTLRYVFEVRSTRTGPCLLKAGVIVSFVVASLPTVVWGVSTLALGSGRSDICLQGTSQNARPLRQALEGCLLSCAS